MNLNKEKSKKTKKIKINWVKKVKLLIKFRWNFISSGTLSIPQSNLFRNISFFEKKQKYSGSAGKVRKNSKEETKLNFKKKATGKAPIAKKKKTDEKQQNEDGENFEFTCWKTFANCENRYQ